MVYPQYSKITTSIFMSVTVSVATIANFVNITPAQAQLFPDQRPTRDRDYNPRRTPNNNIAPNTVPEGFVIPVEYEEEKILVTPEETVPITLLVAADIKDNRRNVLIPYGSEIMGQIQPSDDQSGSLFVAEEIVFPDGTSQSLNAVSNVVTRTEKVKKGANGKDIIKGAAIGAAAATVLSEIFGKIEALEVLGGAGAGAVAGILLGGNEVELVSIDPNKDLNLTLETDLVIK
ncbi:S-layer domain-containing protein [Chondrocystis sp. NIES-4102]|nr:S-layer domain-containing protein [Chondrocystis sp. NIES-4102]